MVEITGSKADRASSKDVADWIERDLKTAKQTGNMATRGLVQNVDLIIAALREYGNHNET